MHVPDSLLLCSRRRSDSCDRAARMVDHGFFAGEVPFESVARSALRRSRFNPGKIPPQSLSPQSFEQIHQTTKKRGTGIPGQKIGTKTLAKLAFQIGRASCR